MSRVTTILKSSTINPQIQRWNVKLYTLLWPYISQDQYKYNLFINVFQAKWLFVSKEQRGKDSLTSDMILRDCMA